jgi:hypothetical protein
MSLHPVRWINQRFLSFNVADMMKTMAIGTFAGVMVSSGVFG